jgi:hypothetical protein
MYKYTFYIGLKCYTGFLLHLQVFVLHWTQIHCSQKNHTFVQLKNLNRCITIKWLLFRLQQIWFKIQLIISDIRSLIKPPKSMSVWLQRIQCPVHWIHTNIVHHTYCNQSKASINHHLLNVKKHSSGEWSGEQRIESRTFIHVIFFIRFCFPNGVHGFFKRFLSAKEQVSIAA